MDFTKLTPDKSKTQAERVADLLASPNLAEIICEHVANGGSLIPLCKIWDVRYSQVVKWIRMKPENSKAYDQAIMDRAEWTKEQILNGIKELTEYDVRELYREDGSMKPVHEWPDVVAKAVTQIESFEMVGKRSGEIKKVKTESRKAALELFGRTQAMFSDKVEHSASDSLAAVIAQTFNRSTETKE